MEHITPRVLSAVVWRQTRPRNGLLDVVDPATYPGRYHRVGDPGTWYAAFTETGAWAEHHRHWTHPDIDATEVRRRIGRARVRRLRVLDLTDADVRSALHVQDDALVADDWKVGQDLGVRARAAGFGGIVAPSAALDGGVNLVVFVHALATVRVEWEAVTTPPPRTASGSGLGESGYG